MGIQILFSYNERHKSSVITMVMISYSLPFIQFSIERKLFLFLFLLFFFTNSISLIKNQQYHIHVSYDFTKK